LSSENLGARQIWEAVLGNLQVQLARSSFNTFLKNTEAISLLDEHLTVNAPNTFIAEYLQNRLLGVIQTAVNRIAQTHIEISFSVDAPGQSDAPTFEAIPSQGLEGPALSTPRVPRISPPRPDGTFANFIVGFGNRLAYAGAVAAAEEPGTKFNPLYLYSEAGLGKTHLLQSILHRATYRGLQALYVSCDRFTEDFVQSIKSGVVAQFRAKYRSCQLLLIDDIQFLEGKKRTQEEFFHLFNELHQANGQIVVTSDRLPTELTYLPDHLRSRLQWGLVAEISPPELQTRIAILKAKEILHPTSIPSDLLPIIARPPYKNIREMEGAYNRVIAMSEAGDLLDLASPEELLISLLAGQPRPLPPSSQAILRITASHYGISQDSMLGLSRHRRSTEARHAAMFLLRDLIQLSFTDIGRIFGGRDHSSAAYGYNKILERLTSDDQFATNFLPLKTHFSFYPTTPSLK